MKMGNANCKLQIANCKLKDAQHGTRYSVIQNPKSKIQNGLTLLEVLIAIGVLSVGLLGVAALIPIGRFSVLETSKADRSADAGRAIARQVRIGAGGLGTTYTTSGVALGTTTLRDASGWYTWQGWTPNQTVPATGWPQNNINTLTAPMAIDPLFIARNPPQSATSNLTWLPYSTQVPHRPPRPCRGGR